jgi:hypothetical protein
MGQLEMKSPLSRTRAEYRKIPTTLRNFFSNRGQISSSRSLFSRRYVLSDGQAREEKGESTKVGEREIIAVLGSYRFVGNDGKTYIVEYTADENGFKAKVNGL